MGIRVHEGDSNRARTRNILRRWAAMSRKKYDKWRKYIESYLNDKAFMELAYKLGILRKPRR